MPLTTYPTNIVCSQGGNSDYYIKSLFYNGSSETLMRVQGRCGCLRLEIVMMVTVGSLCVTFAGSSALLIHPKPHWRAIGSFIHSQTTFAHMVIAWTQGPSRAGVAWGSLHLWAKAHPQQICIRLIRYLLIALNCILILQHF
jgi:hypothetical protein